MDSSQKREWGRVVPVSSRSLVSNEVGLAYDQKGALEHSVCGQMFFQFKKRKGS